MHRPSLSVVVGALTAVATTGRAYAIDTVGSYLRPIKFYQENLTAIEWTSTMEEYGGQAGPDFLLRLDFHFVEMQGAAGNRALTTAIQNVYHTFQDDQVVIPPPSPGLNLYWSSLLPDLPNGVALDADPLVPPFFGRVFEDVDAIGNIANNIYNRATLGALSPTRPIEVRWSIRRIGVVTDPPGQLTKGQDGTWLPLIGTFAVWKCEAVISGTHWDIATFYLPIEYCEFINSDTPITLTQEHFESDGGGLDKRRTKVRYSDFRASNGVDWFPLKEWSIVYRIDDERGNNDNRFGWYAEGDALYSVCGDTSYETTAYRDPGQMFFLSDEFSFSRQLFGPPSTLSIFVQSLDVSTGLVEINGGDTQQPMTPFSWDWGDATQAEGFFPQQHAYADRTRNYAVQVTSHYMGGGADTTETVVRFVAPQISPIQLPHDILVSIPASVVPLTSRMVGYGIPALTFFGDEQFGIVPRTTIEYVLSVAAFVQKDFVNGNVADVGDGFRQVLLRDVTLQGGGMYSLWYTDPVAFGAGAEAVSGSIAYSSFIHEMGHNFTLNSPADFYYGGKIDGNANAIFSESMAQIFQHATAYEMINHAGDYGLSEDLVTDLKLSALASMNFVRNSFDSYVQDGANFHSWNDPFTQEDETFDTFMTIAFKFFEHAETSRQGYRLPLKRMMQLLQILDQGMVDRYDQHHDTEAAETFRSTLMVAAVSHAFGFDLRPEFTALHFPIDHTAYQDLRRAVRLPGDVDFDNDVDLSDLQRLAECLGSLDEGCTEADLNADEAVDLFDFASLQNGFMP